MNITFAEIGSWFPSERAKARQQMVPSSTKRTAIPGNQLQPPNSRAPSFLCILFKGSCCCSACFLSLSWGVQKEINSILLSRALSLLFPAAGQTDSREVV